MKLDLTGYVELTESVMRSKEFVDKVSKAYNRSSLQVQVLLDLVGYDIYKYDELEHRITRALCGCPDCVEEVESLFNDIRLN